ncbi:stage II sporulation protein M [Afifella aestuarii]|uniref:stage II sporulation protein M n=1 Tax=Afifella aestuarii TaxID=1909496 RepID=UPI000FE3D316|nr:stage II sporulation protein M [Afifella aestuarii]
MTTSADVIRSSRFRAEREAGWQRLAAIVAAAEKRGLSKLDFDDARDLVPLYRQAIASLSVAREISLDASVVDYLESLCARAYLLIYAPRETLRGLFTRFFTRSAPQAVRRSAMVILIAYVVMTIGAVAAYLLAMSDPTWFYAFVPESLAGGRGPRASAEALKRLLYDKEGAELGGLGAFASYLFSHNTQVALFSFALGVVVCVPSLLLALYNGAVLGAFTAIHAQKGLALDFVGWLSIHGVTELSAVAIATGGGLSLGLAVLFPGQRSRAAALRKAGRDAAKLALVAALMLVVAGVLESFGRTLVTSLWARIVIGWGLGVCWLAWFSLCGRKRGPVGAIDQMVPADRIGEAS